jgi:hypothetical protein
MNNSKPNNINDTRRSFLKKGIAATVTLASTRFVTFANDNNPVTQKSSENEIPWFRRVTRWGQINITLDTANNFDIAWWRTFWKKTNTQGIVLNAGGIYAYYPTKIPNHYIAPLLGDNDLFGDLCKAAHEDGLVVFARMDSGSCVEQYYNVRPDWFAIDAEGKPYRSGDRYITCINSPYYKEHLPAVLTEIVTKYHPEGVTDNSWAGLGLRQPCFCQSCTKEFHDKTGHDIPRTTDWDDPVFREWIDWNYKRRAEVWEFFTKTTKTAGGPNCTWAGMVSGQVISSGDFRDLKDLCDRADIMMLDHQSRRDNAGFQQNAEAGKYIHGMLGWDKIAPESMRIYSPRLTSQTPQEAEMWMLEGFAGGIAPWWHTVSGYHEDRRRYDTVPPIYSWHKANEQFLFNRKPVASVGVVWSQGNTTWFGRNDTSNTVDLPWRGIIQALVRARIPFIPVHADHIDREAANLKTLILPNYGAMTDKHVESIKRFVDGGGNLFATGESSLYSQYGDQRPDYALADLFRAHTLQRQRTQTGEPSRGAAGSSLHTHLRLTPELGRNVDGPHNGKEPVVTGERHPVFKGFDKTDILPFGGMLEAVKVDPGAEVLMTFIPVCPTMPPEDAWMRVTKTGIQGLIINTTASGSRIAFMPADIDRQFARNNYPDHGNLLANIIRWVSKDEIPLVIEGAGLVDCNLYQQPGRMILHITNLISAGTWRGPIDEYIPIGPITVRVRLPKDVTGKNLKMLVSNQKSVPAVKNGWSEFKVSSILNHEVIVIS